MVIGIFLDRKHKPTAKEILMAVASKRPLWDGLTRFVEDSYGINGDFAFYGKNYGWAARYRKSGKALISMYPGKDSFTAQIVLGEDKIIKASQVNLGPSVRRVLEEAHKFPEGRWLFIKIESAKDLDDVKQLMLIKSPKKRDK